MDHAALTKFLRRTRYLTSTCKVVGRMPMRREATTKVYLPRLWPQSSTSRNGVLDSASVRASNCATAHRHFIKGKPCGLAHPSSTRPTSAMATNNGSDNNNNNSTHGESDATEALLRAMSDSLQGIGEALTHEDLKPSAPWGLAIYRTTYGDDASWERMRDALSVAAVEALELYSYAESLLPRLSHAFIEDRATLAGAAVRDVRRRFEAWAAEELRRNWRDDEPPTVEEARQAGVESPGYLAGTRYNFCLMVDEVCLESLDSIASPVVKLVKKDFASEEDNHDDSSTSGVIAYSDWEDGVTGCEEEDVGWMYLPVADYVDCCNQLHDPEFWHDGYYVRPPLTFLTDLRTNI